MKNNDKNLEKELLEITRQKENADKILLFLEVFIGIILILIMLTLTAIASFVQMDEWLRFTLIMVGFIPLVIVCPFMLRIEQIAGYYECSKCGHKHIPKFSSVFWAMHINRTRYLKCPECKQRSWQKKVLSKD